jgi:hypothetical protein
VSGSDPRYCQLQTDADYDRYCRVVVVVSSNHIPRHWSNEDASASGEQGAQSDQICGDLETFYTRMFIRAQDTLQLLGPGMSGIRNVKEQAELCRGLHHPHTSPGSARRPYPCLAPAQIPTAAASGILSERVCVRPSHLTVFWTSAVCAGASRSLTVALCCTRSAKSVVQASVPLHAGS